MNSDSVILNEKISTELNPHKTFYFIIKRIFDILFGIFGIFVMLFLAFIIKAVSIFNKDCFYNKSSLYF